MKNMGFEYNMVLNNKIAKDVKAIEALSGHAEEEIIHLVLGFEHWDKGELYFTPKWNDKLKKYEVGFEIYGEHQNTDVQSSKFRTREEAQRQCNVQNDIIKVKQTLYGNLWASGI